MFFFKIFFIDGADIYCFEKVTLKYTTTNVREKDKSRWHTLNINTLRGSSVMKMSAWILAY